MQTQAQTYKDAKTAKEAAERELPTADAARQVELRQIITDRTTEMNNARTAFDAAKKKVITLRRR
jgi:hypothetical protein